MNSNFHFVRDLFIFFSPISPTGAPHFHHSLAVPLVTFTPAHPYATIDTKSSLRDVNNNKKLYSVVVIWLLILAYIYLLPIRSSQDNHQKLFEKRLL